MTTGVETTFHRSERLATGWSAVLGSALSVVLIALYFVYSGPPPATNVFTRTLITLAALTAYVIFAVGLSRLLRSDGDGDGGGLAGQVAVTFLVSYIVLTLVATSMEAGTDLQYPDGSLDPTVDGPLAAGMAMLHGPIGHVFIAGFLIALTTALCGRSVFARWVLAGNVTLAIINLATIPSLFFGMNAANFYAANGWGSVASMGGLNIIWLAVLGTAVLRSDPKPDPALH